MKFPIEDRDGTLGYAVHDLPVGSEYLIAWVAMGLGEHPEINIYGNPQGLRALAKKLLEVAEIDQSKADFPDEDSFHIHCMTGCNTETTSPRLTIGRVDSKNDPEKLRSCFPSRVPEFSSDKCIH